LARATVHIANVAILATATCAISCGIDTALKAAPIDEAAARVWGGSYGGLMTMWAVTQTDRFKAAVAAAISNWLSYYGENGIDAWMLPYFGASVMRIPAAYARSSPINFIRNVHTPTFRGGERDIECPARDAGVLACVEDLGIPTAIMIYPGEATDFENRNTRRTQAPNGRVVRSIPEVKPGPWDIIRRESRRRCAQSGATPALDVAASAR